VRGGRFGKVKGHSDPQPKSTAEKIADEHGISEKTVKRSADLLRSTLATLRPWMDLSPPGIGISPSRKEKVDSMGSQKI